MKKIIVIILCFLIGQCLAAPLYNSFNSGELTPLLKYRVDLEKRSMGVETMENMFVKPHGAAIRRPGTKYIATTKSSGQARLIPFEYSTTDTYIMEFGNQYIRFYRNAGQIQSGGSAYEISTSFTTSQLRDLQFVQINDVMYIVHPDITPQKLSRLGHASWTIADANWTWGPFQDENTTTTTITPSGTTGSITLTASASIFDSDHIGSIWQIIEKSDNTYTKGTLDANESSSSIDIEGDGLLTLEGTWTALVALEKSSDGSNWETVYPKLNGEGTNIEYAFSEDLPDYSYRVTMSDKTAGSCDYTLTAYNTNVSGYAEVTAYTSPTVVTATVISALASTDATTKWSEGAWSDHRGWPRSICLYQNRLCFGGNSYMPNVLWTSQSGDYENMKTSDLDTGSIVYEVGSAKQNPILWLQDKNGIIAGTTGSVIRIFSQSNTSTLTASSIGSERQSEVGSCNIQAQLARDSIVFIDRNKRKVSDLVYDLQSDSFVSPELTTLAEHITDPCFIEVAVQNRPDTIIWFVRGDGVLVSLTYSRDQSVIVIAWARHITDGTFESVAVIPGTDEDEVWTIVNRSIGGSTVRYIEQIQPQDWGDDANDMFFVDSGLTYSGSATSTLTGLSHLEGETVQVFGDGGYYQTAAVSGGEVSLDTTVTHAVAGLGYTSKLITFPIEMQTQEGFSVGEKKKIRRMIASVYKSIGGEYGYNGGTMYDIPYPVIMDAGDTYSGLVKFPFEGGYRDEADIYLRQTKPYPFAITSLVPKIEISDDR